MGLIIPLFSEASGENMQTIFLSFKEALPSLLAQETPPEETLQQLNSLFSSIDLPYLLLCCSLLMIASLLGTFFMLIQYVVNFALVFKSWQILQPLREKLTPEESHSFFTPLKALLYMLIPVFSLYGNFPAYAGINTWGEKYARCRQLPYTGPNHRLSVGFPVFYILQFILPFLFILSPLYLYMLNRRYNTMINTFLSADNTASGTI